GNKTKSVRRRKRESEIGKETKIEREIETETVIETEIAKRTETAGEITVRTEADQGKKVETGIETENVSGNEKGTEKKRKKGTEKKMKKKLMSGENLKENCGKKKLHTKSVLKTGRSEKGKKLENMKRKLSERRKNAEI
ncbi:hypothetical protein GDO81_019185, partial [Engystomops pustulosus]